MVRWEMMDGNDLVSRIRVTVLIEDYAGYESPLLGNHGISLLLEINHSDQRKCILFDVSQGSKAILQNMEMLRISPNSVDLVFLSHCHYDHTGGLMGMLNAINRKDVPVLGHPTLFRPHYVLEPSIRHVGVPRECCPEALGDLARLVLIRESLSLMPGVISTGEVEREVSFEKVPTVGTFTEEKGKLLPDLMLDDLSLVIKIKAKGIVVISGCSHAGIVNITKQAIRLTGESRITAVIGGLHLIDADENRIHETAKALRDLNVERLYVGHCTGLKGEAALLQAFADRLVKLHSGMVIEI